MEKRSGVADFFRNLDLVVACLALTGLICITVSGVVMRYFAGKPIVWLEEVQLWFIVWIVFLGAAATARRGGHIAIDAFIGLFPRRLRMAAAVIGAVVTIVVMGFFGYYAVRHTFQMYTSWRVTNLLHIPYCIIYAVVPVTCLQIVVYSGQALARALASRDGGAKHV